MRHSLLLRLLGLSLAVASLAIAATALLASYGTGSQLREEAENSASLLETDSRIHTALRSYASEHPDWDGVKALVRELAEGSGRRIRLTTPGGEPIADSEALLNQGSGEPPETPSARIDATDPSGPTTRVLQLRSSDPATGAARLTGAPIPGDYTWGLTEQEQQHRQALVEQANECLQAEGIDARVYPVTRSVAGSRYAAFATGDEKLAITDDADRSELAEGHACIPDELNEPSAAALERNQRAVELATACLDEHDLAYEVSADSYGMRIVEPAAGDEPVPGGGGGRAELETQWTECQETAEIEATRPYVAPPADLYLGASERFEMFSTRTAATAAAVFAIAALVTVLAGRRLVRPILALTAAAQRMGAGDRAARVPARGGDEVTRLARAFNAMADSIERSDQQRKALVSDVAHELRTPLANVRSLLEAAEEEVLPRDATLIQSLQEEATLLERLVSDLQDLALADAGMLPLHPEERDAADLAGQAVAAHRAQADAAGVTIWLEAPEPVPVRADPARLRQALGNLVSNAVTHTPTGGTVTVAVQHCDGAARLTVTDTGAGITPEHLPHVFDRFYRADPSRSRATGGSGLGLTITRHLVEAHGGQVDATSTLGQGSTFTIQLPAPE